MESHRNLRLVANVREAPDRGPLCRQLNPSRGIPQSKPKDSKRGIVGVSPTPPCLPVIHGFAFLLHNRISRGINGKGRCGNGAQDALNQEQ